MSSEYEQRREHLKKLGFTNAVIETWQKRALNLFTEEFVNKKLAGLKGRGFDNPVKMITSSPAILGLAFENIDEKLHFARRLSKFGVNGVKLAELFPALLGYNIRRLRLLARVVFAVMGGDAKFFLALVTKRQDAVVSGLLMQKQPSKSGVLRAARDRRNREENLAVIQSHALANKIAQAYLRYSPG